jgi:hypothetical protein
MRAGGRTRPGRMRMPPTSEDLTFEALDDLILAHERGRVPAVRLAPGPSLGALVELVRFAREHEGALAYAATPETDAIDRACRTRRPVYLNGEWTGVVTAKRQRNNGSDIYREAFMFAMHKALLAAGFASPFASGLVGALGEMESNVHEHSQAADTGLIAYRVSTDAVECIVADGGIGVLSSLRRGAFPSLTDAGEALKIALTDGRSRYGIGKGRGYGFRELFKALSTRNGSLRFRSDDQLLTIRGDSPVLSRARLQQRATVSGFSISVVCLNPAATKRR